ncbi:MAG: hypothetical protein MZV70_14280 [Desulfobacterales bacterium]|nr:hypothetical protein [Desulfobacterales bacterium]
MVGDKVVQTGRSGNPSRRFTSRNFLECSARLLEEGKEPQRAALELSKRLHQGRCGYRWCCGCGHQGILR